MKNPYFPPPKISFIPDSLRIKKLENPRYLKTKLMEYQEGKFSKRWEILEPNHNVGILIYHKQKDAFIIVRQFRPAVYYAEQTHSQSNQANIEAGYTHELCAGLIDKENKSIEQIAHEEVIEECGYKPKNLIPIQSFLNNTGSSGAVQHLFYTEVDDEDKCGDGGGVDDECIEVLELPLCQSLDFIFDNNIKKTTSLFLAIHWYHYTFKKES